jgi:hypothetical protein
MERGGQAMRHECDQVSGEVRRGIPKQWTQWAGDEGMGRRRDSGQAMRQWEGDEGLGRRRDSGQSTRQWAVDETVGS